MKDNERKLHNEDMKNGKFYTSHTNEEINVFDTFNKIRKTLCEFNYHTSEKSTTLSDDLQLAVATYRLLFDGLLSLYEETSLGDNMDDDDLHALQMNWYRLKDLIEKREEEHNKIWMLAFHGKEGGA